MQKLSIIIPCHNEAENLPLLISEIAHAMNRDDVEVVLVNDGSTDSSAQVLEKHAGAFPYIKVVTNERSRGYGGAVLAGLTSAQGTYIGWMHGDLQTPFKDSLLALSKIESLGEPEDIYVKGLRKGRPVFDQFFTLGMSAFETLLLWKKLFDINAQPNIFHRSFFDSWKNPPTDFSLDLYALYMAHTQHLTVVRIPVIFPPRKYGHSHWNTGLQSKIKFIKRTITYSVELQKKVALEYRHRGLDPLAFLKYSLAGGAAGLIHLALLYAFTEFFGINYLISTSVALFIVFWISFVLQKYWTFKEASPERFKKQAAYYFVMHSINFAVNAALMYLFVSIFGIWYMLSQVCVSLSMAVITFLLNKKYIFK